MAPVFSLILPTRQRVKLLDALLRSIDNTARCGVEVLIAGDYDDAETMAAASTLKERSPFARFFFRDRQPNLSEGYYNFLARHARGDYLIVLNDDCELTTPFWDWLAMPYLHSRGFPDRIFYGRTCDRPNMDSTASGDCGINGYACFPLLTRRAVELQGYFFHPEFTGWCADVALHKVWSGLGRVLDLPMLTIRHISHHNQTRERDAINENVEKLSTYNWAAVDTERERLRKLLEVN